jgi:murein L,D-transpeptidase YafK
MVHGGCKSVGCYAMTDYAMDEIYGLVDEAFRGGQEKVQLEAFPFRMTTQNLARHADDPHAPFWEMLKTGSDAFLATGRPPTVAVCDQRYVFNAAIADCDPSKEKAKPIASYVPRWGVWLAADLEESRAWAIYHERQKQSVTANRSCCLDKFPAWAGRSATSSPLLTIIAPRSKTYARNSTLPTPPAMCCGIVAVIEAGRR